jgi:hypothetical protein
MIAPADPAPVPSAREGAREYIRQVMEPERESWSRLDAAVILAVRVEMVHEFCLLDEVTFASDLEHHDPVVRALARGRVSACEQVLRLLNGERV